MISGAAGSGKTLLLEVLAGRHAVSGGSIDYPQLRKYLSAIPDHDPLTDASNFIAYIASRHHFRNLSNTSEFYYQQRFNSSDSENAPTVLSYLEKRVHPAHPGEWDLEKVINQFNLQSLVDEHLIKLSNGETKRLSLAAAMIRNPKVLVMDNPFIGLDVNSRKAMNDWLQSIASTSVNIILSGSLLEIPSVITHIVHLEPGKPVVKSDRSVAVQYIAKPGENGGPDQQVLKSLLNRKSAGNFDKIISMKGVHIRYGEKQVLQDINWEVKAGERWALTGRNGAGKSTLLSLVNGDNPQAYANDIVLFDRKRGSGESIWDIKKNIGFISPELFQYFPTDSTCIHVIESGFYDTIGLFRPSSPNYVTICKQWMEEMQIGSIMNRPFRLVSTSQQRLCLLARALVKNPALLILDEPCQGLDAMQQLFFKRLIDSICANSNVSLIYVSHYAEELPDSISHRIILENGKRVE
jgi:molybdate transport system ATP-binding protein